MMDQLTQLMIPKGEIHSETETCMVRIAHAGWGEVSNMSLKFQCLNFNFKLQFLTTERQQL